MTPEGETRLIEHEGERLSAYADSRGFLTIGIGHCIDARVNGAITQRVSRELFEDDVARCTASARANFEWVDQLDPVRQDVIVMLVFNMGVGGVKGFKKMIEAIKQQNWTQAAWELSNSQWALQVQKQRRVELCDALEKGEWK